jgi:hypothetical protein
LGHPRNQLPPARDRINKLIGCGKSLGGGDGGAGSESSSATRYGSSVSLNECDPSNTHASAHQALRHETDVRDLDGLQDVEHLTSSAHTIGSAYSLSGIIGVANT